ncbi:hypothetical protein BV20DRAFT_377117 [Pilatotrama ljubarskyi]|nr:hypothetical protein BV20DRAFT_377117 [Pilatotrama ljubarskyi]
MGGCGRETGCPVRSFTSFAQKESEWSVVRTAYPARPHGCGPPRWRFHHAADFLTSKNTAEWNPSETTDAFPSPQSSFNRSRVDDMALSARRRRVSVWPLRTLLVPAVSQQSLGTQFGTHWMFKRTATLQPTSSAARLFYSLSYTSHHRSKNP